MFCHFECKIQASGKQCNEINKNTRKRFSERLSSFPNGVAFLIDHYELAFGFDIRNATSCYLQHAILSCSWMIIAHRIIGLLLLLCFASTLFWCGDNDCLKGINEEQCISLFCAIVDTHSHPEQNKTADDSRICACICHLPAIVENIAEDSYLHSHQQHADILLLYFPVPPDRPIYHPPLAA